MFGYGGKILRVNLSSGRIRSEQYDAEFAWKYLGGNGFAAKLVHDGVPAQLDPFHQDNAVVFAVGPLTDTGVWSSSRGHIGGISPLTGFFGDSNYGGNFAVAQKRTGFDAIYITGQASEPVYLLVTEEGGQLKDASSLWGLTPGQTIGELTEREGKKAVVLTIGPAGENKVLFAGILCGGTRHGVAARCGLGAVLGSENLKAIVAAGRQRTENDDPSGLEGFLKEKT